MTDHFDDDDPQFWNGEPWSDRARVRRPRRTANRDHTGSIERTRSHHVVVHRDAADDQSAWSYGHDDGGYSGLADHDDQADRWADDAIWVEPQRHPPRRPGGVGVDPRLVRLGAIAVAAVMMIPVALAVRGDAGSDEGSQPQLRTEAPDSPSEVTAPGPSPKAERARRRATTTTTADRSEAASANVIRGDARGDNDVEQEQQVVGPSCTETYTVVAGDYWLRFVDTSGAGAVEWLNANGATLDTPLYVGDQLCIPAGGTAPGPPPTTTVPDTTAPRTTKPPTTPVPTTQPPTTPPTTDPPTTPPTTDPPTTPPTTDPPTPGSVEAIIRSVWPDELEEKALMIARRESNLIPTARNYCCYGLFQIYFEVHRSWLDELGITRAEHLFDPLLNARAAYALYQREGWSPWSMTAG